MRAWTNTHTVAVLWLIAACLVLFWIAGLVSEYQTRLDWSQVAPSRVTPTCKGPTRGAWFP